MGWFGRVRSIVFRVLDAEAQDSRLERAGNVALASLILTNVVAVVLETVPSLAARFGPEFSQFEALSVTVFSVEYVLRVWTSVELARYRDPMAGRLRYALSPMALLDLIAIVPAYLPGAVYLDLRFARVVRLVRMARVLRIARYSRALQTLGSVLREKRDELAVLVALMLVVLVIASSSMYFVEHTAQPEVFSSIPASMWWGVTTLTTVGYGDMYPVTPLGKLLGAVVALVGIGLFALPAGVLAAAFAEQFGKRREAGPKLCPHCGREIG